jgi:hypothetical protein
MKNAVSRKTALKSCQLAKIPIPTRYQQRSKTHSVGSLMSIEDISSKISILIKKNSFSTLFCFCSVAQNLVFRLSPPFPRQGYMLRKQN